MHGDDGVHRVGLAVEHRPGFEVFVECSQRLDLALDLAEHVLALAGQLDVGLDLAGAAQQLLIVGDHDLQALFLAH